MIKVAIIEDNEIINHSLTILIEKAEEIECVGSYFNCEDMLEDIEIKKPDILLMDIKLPGMNGIEGVKIVKSILPESDILMLTIHEENDLIFEALCAGACGYLVKKTHPQKIIEAIREAYNGGAPISAQIARKVTNFFKTNKVTTPNKTLLTEREHQIMSEFIKGKTYYAIAITLNISTDTVRYHIKKIYKKLHVHSQAEAVAEAIKKGII